jgi:homoserine kinase type II
MNLSQLWRAWPLPGPWKLRPTPSGTNNLVHYVETPSGERYILRLHQNSDAPRLRYEVTITQALQEAGLSFAVPSPLPTLSGEMYLPLSTETGEMLATLWPLLPGDHPQRQNLRQAYAAGQALAELHAALERMPSPHIPDAIAPTPYGDLERCHPYVPDPMAACQALPVEAKRKRRLCGLFEALGARIPALYQTLPQHLIHGDYAPSNILMLGERVSGVLDFEVSTVDLRMLDLAVAFSWWPVALLGTGAEWAIIKALGRGYTSRSPLTPAEVEALPDLLRLRAIAAFIHRLGRYLAGLETMAVIDRRVMEVLWRERWLVDHRDQLLRNVT